MALSQIQCLDDHHVNWRVSESKPEFFYSEDQRLALEALLTKGRDGFSAYIREHGIRDFLSDLELERLECTAEAYRPGHELKPETTGGGNAGSGEEGGDGAVSLQYWPDRSEASVAELDLGWPDAISYRGVTRVTVNTQPPAEGQTHIKEVVRKSIASAQKVIAVVMDAFTDVDIFRDLLDAAYKRRVPVYIIIDTAAVRDFLSMCGRADMHHGHLKNLRVRCCGGVEFYTRSAQKVRGSLSQRFLLIDGDRAISGSYSFTWSSSRLDRNLITVVTGQAVENFDTQFRDLYLTSRGVSLAKVPLTEEPTPDPIPQAAPAPLSASMARKLINPKYALVATGNHASPASSNQNSNNKNPAGLRLLKGRIKEPVELPPLHPGLASLEKVYLIPYLPTWPEPDPPSDVIGFINIRDDKRANQVHLQRSERFEVSQAIRFSSPFTAAAAPTDTPTEGTGTDTQPSEGSAAQNQAAAQPTAQPTEHPHIAPNAQHSSQPCQRADTPREQPAHTPETRTSIAPAAADVTGAAPTNATDHTPTAGASDRPQAPPLVPSQAPPLEPPQAPLLEPPQAPPLEPPQAPPRKPPQAPPQDPPLAPPIPKPRTLQLVINGPGSEHTGQPQVSLVKKSESEALHDSSDYVRTHDAEERPSQSEEEQEEVKASDSSQDSTEVMCDQVADGNPSSLSTASDEEFYDCNQSGEVVANGMTTGSGQGHRHGDGVNVMARLSQSMLDLRDPSQSGDSADLIHQSQQLRRQVNASPHRHIGQLFQSSRSSNQEQQMRGAKVVIAKPGSYHRPTRASGPVIGGHRYWMGQALQTDSSLLRPEQRSGRSPRRHSPAHRKTVQGSPQPPANLAGVLGLSFSKLTNLKHLRSLAAGSQRKTPQNYKDAI